MLYKNIYIGALIRQRVKELNIKSERICNFLSCNETQVKEFYQSKDISTDALLRWSKLLEYDFFRLYSQHLILYSPPSSNNYNKISLYKESSLPEFKKNLYTYEVISFMLELIETGEKTKQQIVDEYRIPKTTLYKWVSKYKK
jgi:hypothetical protein